MPQYLEDYDGPRCEYHLCPVPVDSGGERCEEHTVENTSPETMDEHKAKMERLEEVKGELESLIDILGRPDNSHLLAALEKVEVTIEKMDNPVSKRFRYGNYRDTSPRVAEYEVDELDTPECNHEGFTAKYVGDGYEAHEWVRECDECSESVAVVYDEEGGKGDGRDNSKEDNWGTLT